MSSILIPAQSIFLAILIESLPFVMVGAILSSLIHVFVPEDVMLRVLPKRRWAAVMISGLLGFLVPVCDCGTIPVTKSLMAKGVHRSAAITFTLAAPVINPVTLIATYFAFGYHLKMVLLRAGCAYVIACLIGLIVSLVERSSVTLAGEQPVRVVGKHGHSRRQLRSQLVEVVEHTVHEFFGIVSFLIISAAVASVYQVYRAEHSGLAHQHGGAVATITLMALAIVFSLCSEADAFVARSFAASYAQGSVLSFMLIGQMADLRNLFLLPRTFGQRTGIAIIAGCLGLCFVVGLLW